MRPSTLFSSPRPKSAEIRAIPGVACSDDRLGDSPLCFVMPAAKTATGIRTHQRLKAKVVRPGDRLINVFPKHQAEIEQVRIKDVSEAGGKVSGVGNLP